MGETPKQNLPPKILLVDDDSSVAQGLEDPLAKHQVKVESAKDLETALYKFNTMRFDVALVELDFGPLPGLALVQKWRAHEKLEKRTTAFVMVSGNKNLGTNAGLIKELGDLESIVKPFSAINLLPFLARGLATKRRLDAFQETKEKVLEYFTKSKDLTKAVNHVKSRLSELGPKGYKLLYDLYEKSGNYQDALAVLNPLIEKEPQNIALLNAKGRLLMRLKKYPEAKVLLEKADQLAPSNIMRIQELAVAMLQLKEPDQAVMRMKELIELNPEQPEIKFDMFTNLFDNGYEDHAINFGKETTHPSEIVRHYNNKGVLLSKEGANEKAIQEYQRALKFFPKFRENFRIYFNIALAHAQEKNHSGFLEAEKYLTKCLEMAPEFEKGKTTLEAVEKTLSKIKKAS